MRRQSAAPRRPTAVREAQSAPRPIATPRVRGASRAGPGISVHVEAASAPCVKCRALPPVRRSRRSTPGRPRGRRRSCADYLEAGTVRQLRPLWAPKLRGMPDADRAPHRPDSSGHEPVHPAATRPHRGAPPGASGVSVALVAAAVALEVCPSAPRPSSSRGPWRTCPRPPPLSPGDGRTTAVCDVHGDLTVTCLVDGRRIHQRRYDDRQHLAVRRPGRTGSAPSRVPALRPVGDVRPPRSLRSTARSPPGRTATSTATCSSGGPACTTAATARTDGIAGTLETARTGTQHEGPGPFDGPGPSLCVLLCGCRSSPGRRP